MDREVLYRGKRVDNGEWIFGDLIENQGRFYIYQASNITTLPWDAKNQIAVCGYEIEPETRGEYTGLKDRNGKRIFEGDVVETPWDGWSHGRLVHYKNGLFKAGTTSLCSFIGADSPEYHCEVIGNIHDNPELVEV